MSSQSQLILATFCGAIALAVIELASDDWKAMADQREKETCPEKPDQAAFMGRKPGEGHNVESCIYIMRYGDPRWIPDFQSPLGPTKHQAR